MSLPNLSEIEQELKKRHQYPYKWFQKQNDLWDNRTNFIYSTPYWEALIPQIANLVKTHNFNKQHIFQYAANRWYNFWSAQAVEQIFAEMENVETLADRKDSEKDFYLFGIPFDHKTSVFPRQFNKRFEYAQTHKAELITWLYENQSSQKRHHSKNRLFIVVYNHNGEHWKMKAEISLLKKAIKKYVQSFDEELLSTFTFAENQITLSDIIWVSE
ncbi:hypothetical protein QRD02_01895 [Aequorivita sp. SDUM287046]|uniref:Uncharacterized protein n=1 Tax=Aequorivita aurantiaca TaxID=3053356 RepID=A0ABT8DD53_9FLAO|nr:hypothetical protein [Aequorivita aurantiaca]MDN3723120.1 hypothetical protein [Aequorivita aurantiaca]